MRTFITTFCVGALISTGVACLSSSDAGRQADNIEDKSPRVERNDAVIDRAGRPEINVFIVRAPEPQLAHNQQDAHALPAEAKAAFKGLLQAGIAFWDALDGESHWGAEGGAALAEAMVRDYLVVDTSKICGVDDDTYFEIERAPIGENTTCGGRTPNGDAIDALLTLLIGGSASEIAYGDAVDAPAKRAGDAFPYLQAPHEDE